MSPADLWIAWHTLNEATAAMVHFYDDHDLLLTSTLSEPPWPTAHYDVDAATLDEIEDDLFAYAGLTPVANTAGLPAMSVPLSIYQGLPVGSHFIGPYASEGMLLSLAAQLERARPFPRLYGRDATATGSEARRHEIGAPDKSLRR
jgi:amidase